MQYLVLYQLWKSHWLDWTLDNIEQTGPSLNRSHTQFIDKYVYSYKAELIIGLQAKTNRISFCNNMTKIFNLVPKSFKKMYGLFNFLRHHNWCSGYSFRLPTGIFRFQFWIWELKTLLFFYFTLDNDISRVSDVLDIRYSNSHLLLPYIYKYKISHKKTHLIF